MTQAPGPCSSIPFYGAGGSNNYPSLSGQLEEYCHWPIIVDLNQHIRPEFALLRGRTLCSQKFRKAVYQRAGYIWQGSIGKRWPAAFARICI